MPAPHAGGFDIDLQERRKGYIVRFEGWTRTFDRDDDALDCLELGAVGLVPVGGGVPRAYAGGVDARSPGVRDVGAAPHAGGAGSSHSGGPARTEYKQNDVITKAEPAAVD